MKKVGHPFEGDVDTADQWNVLDPPFCLGDHAPSDYMGGNSPDKNHKDQKQNEAARRHLSGSNIPREILDQFVECVE
jgi:hypothetical protein